MQVFVRISESFLHAAALSSLDVNSRNDIFYVTDIVLRVQPTDSDYQIRYK